SSPGAPFPTLPCSTGCARHRAYLRTRHGSSGKKCSRFRRRGRGRGQLCGCIRRAARAGLAEDRVCRAGSFVLLPLLLSLWRFKCSTATLKVSPSDRFSAPFASPSRTPVREPNRCNLEPLKPETPKITLYLVLAQGRLTLQVVWLGRAHFQLPVRPPKSPSRPTRENPGRPCGGGLGGGAWPTPRGRRVFSTIRGSPMAAMTRMGFWHTGSPAGPHAKPAESSGGGREGHARRGGLQHQRNPT